MTEAANAVPGSDSRAPLSPTEIARLHELLRSWGVEPRPRNARNKEPEDVALKQWGARFTRGGGPVGTIGELRERWRLEPPPAALAPSLEVGPNFPAWEVRVGAGPEGRRPSWWANPTCAEDLKIAPPYDAGETVVAYDAVRAAVAARDAAIAIGGRGGPSERARMDRETRYLCRVFRSMPPPPNGFTAEVLSMVCECIPSLRLAAEAHDVVVLDNDTGAWEGAFHVAAHGADWDRMLEPSVDRSIAIMARLIGVPEGTIRRALRDRRQQRANATAEV